MGIFNKVMDYFDERRDREVADIDRRMALTRYQSRLINLYRYLVNEKKKEQYRADIYGATDVLNELKEDIGVCKYLIDRIVTYSSKEDFIEENRDDIEYIFGKYQHLIYPEGR